MGTSAGLQAHWRSRGARGAPAASAGRCCTARRRCCGACSTGSAGSGPAPARSGHRRRQPDRRRRGQDTDRARFGRDAARPWLSARHRLARLRRRCDRRHRSPPVHAGAARAATSRCCCACGPTFRCSSAATELPPRARCCRRIPAVDLVVADDGLQHLRLHRDVQVIVFDERGAGNGWLLPAGPLREPMPAAVPPRSLVLYNAPAATTPLPGDLAAASAVRRGGAGRAGGMAGPRDRRRSRRCAGGASSPRPALRFPERFHAMLRDAGLDIDAAGAAGPLRLDRAALAGRHSRTSSSPRRTPSRSTRRGSARPASGSRR